MSEFESQPRVVVWGGSPPMSAGAPEPAIFADADVLMVAYRIEEPPKKVGGLEVAGCQDPQVASGEHWAVICFDNYTQLRYGYPNDEALDGHPLYQAGLQYYEIQEVVNSPWANELMSQNAVHSNNSESLWAGKRHWVLAFHDETMDVLTRSEPSVFLEVAPSAALALTARLTRNLIR